MPPRVVPHAPFAFSGSNHAAKSRSKLRLVSAPKIDGSRLPSKSARVPVPKSMVPKFVGSRPSVGTDDPGGGGGGGCDIEGVEVPSIADGDGAVIDDTVGVGGAGVPEGGGPP